jgi:hypothetical protein
MTTYLGKDPGKRVIAGSIDRGRAVSVPAVLWYSDLQGFTKIADAVCLLPEPPAADHGRGDQSAVAGDPGMVQLLPLRGGQAHVR